MGLLRSLLLAPVTAPFQGTRWVAEKILECAETEFSDPARIKATLVALERDLEAGHLTEEEFEAAETVLLMRLRGASR